MGFLRFILFVILFILIIQFIVRFIFPWMVKRFIQRNINPDQRSGKQKKGEVTIEFKNNNKKKYDKNDGEYIEFEEVND